jgi:hypothetical protein
MDGFTFVRNADSDILYDSKSMLCNAIWKLGGDTKILCTGFGMVAVIKEELEIGMWSFVVLQSSTSLLKLLTYRQLKTRWCDEVVKLRLTRVKNMC